MPLMTITGVFTAHFPTRFQMTLRTTLLSTTALAAFLCVAAAPPAALPTTLFSGSEPTDIKDVAAAKRAAVKGEPITVRGRVGGSASPIVNGIAAFTLVDMALPPCNLNPDDHCTRPWDYCCEPKSRIAEHAATVQVVGADGRPLRVGLEGHGGVVPLSELVISGTVAATDQSRVLIINAERVHVAQLGSTRFDSTAAPTPPAPNAPSLKEGQSITFRGAVGGERPFDQETARMTVAGEGWTIDVRVDDWLNRPLAAPLEGVNGLAAGREVAVQGRVIASGAKPVVRAERIWVVELQNDRK